MIGTALSFERMTSVVGARVSGVDLAEPQASEVVEQLDRAVAEHGVLFFHDQQALTPASHVAFGAAFGELFVHPWVKNLGPEHPEVMVLASETLPNGGRESIRWHADATFDELPPRGSILRAVEVPSSGGDTLWASMVAAYAGLSSKLQRFIDGLHAEHQSDSFRRLIAQGKALEDAPTEMTSSTHPVVTHHPVTGERSLFVNVIFTKRIVELSQLESDRVLALLWEHVKAPDFQVRFNWEPGAVAFWDNRATQHYVVADYTERRVMHRVTIRGDKPQ